MKMKFLLLFLLSLILFSCNEESNISPILSGELFIDSEPEGAEIFLLGENTNEVTPHLFTNLESGDYIVTLKKSPFQDTSFTTIVHQNLRTSEYIVFNLSIEVTSFSHTIIDTIIVFFPLDTIKQIVVFNGKFNQDLIFENVNILAPWGTSGDFPYNDTLIGKNSSIIIPDPQMNTFIQDDIGVWQFKFTGEKVEYSQEEFIEEYEYIIP
jgi:hypothetical protein